jgi:hypothetical protein
VPVNLSRYVAELRKEIEDPALLQFGADAMAETMQRATARFIGGDLRMSNFPGAAPTFKTTTKGGAATLEIGGGTYALADRGRRQATPARAGHRRGKARGGGRRRALRTPWGPRASVQGSTWSGFHITDRYADIALDDGKRAIIAALDKEIAA